MSKSIPTADLHTPEEILENANELLSSNNLKMMRAAILESITALEVYVENIVFPILSKKHGEEFSLFLKEKTKMDFENRLLVVTPFAIGVHIDKSKKLWADYKKAKEIRNKIVHAGIKATKNDADYVIKTVYEWIAYLGSTVELELSLIKLKEYIESHNISVNSEYEAIVLISDFFKRTKAAITTIDVALQDSKGNARRADLILQFGVHRIVVETKFVHTFLNEELINRSINQVSSLSDSCGATQATIVIFYKDEIKDRFESVRKLNNGSLYILFIQII